MCMWSATWPKEVKRLAEDFLGRFLTSELITNEKSFRLFSCARTDFCHINIGSGELSANHDILQVF